MKRVLVLGAGLVSGPLVRHLLGFPDVTLTVADLDASKAERVARGHPRSRTVGARLDDPAEVDRLAAGADLLISLLPFTLHVPVARIAIARRIPLITTSYVSPEMRSLDTDAREAGVLLLNEIGVDPGLDHMSAMRVITRLKAQGERLTAFRSCCGGLPAPEANTNPWGYKFSWSPRGVLLAGRSAARWLEDGRIVELPGEALFSHVEQYEVPGLGLFEVYPNRDAISYVATYGIEGVRTMFRGTIRHPGWCATLGAVARLGLLDLTPRRWRAGTTYAQFMESLAGPGRGSSLRSRVAERAGLAPDDPVLGRLEWAGLLSDRPIGQLETTPLDVLCARLEEVMTYAPSERDMIVLRHDFASSGESGASTTVSTLTVFGEPGGDSAMAKAVSLPAAVAARLILEGRIPPTGVKIPVDAEIREPVLDALERLGIRFDEQTTRVGPPP